MTVNTDSLSLKGFFETLSIRQQWNIWPDLADFDQLWPDLWPKVTGSMANWNCRYGHGYQFFLDTEQLSIVKVWTPAASWSPLRQMTGNQAVETTISTAVSFEHYSCHIQMYKVILAKSLCLDVVSNHFCWVTYSSSSAVVVRSFTCNLSKEFTCDLERS